jgi:hypothetical protein
VENTDNTTQTPTKAATRDELRSAFLDAPIESELIDYRGFQIELRPQELGDLLQYREASNDDTIMARAIIAHCWVPGTNERIFDDADIPQIMKVKMTADMRRLTTKITKMLGGDDILQQAIEDNTKSNQR